MQIIILTQDKEMVFNPKMITIEEQIDDEYALNGNFDSEYAILGLYCCQGNADEVMANFRNAIQKAIAAKLPAVYFEMPKYY